MSPTRKTQRRRAPRRSIERTTFRNLSVAGATLSEQAAGTASRITNLTDIIEQTISQPDIELNRSLLMSVRGRVRVTPDDLNIRTYSLGLLVAPFSIDAADVDPKAVGAQGFNWWYLRSWMIQGHTVTSDDITPEFRSVALSYRTRGMRRLRGFGESLLLVESVTGSDLDFVAHILDVTVGLA